MGHSQTLEKGAHDLGQDVANRPFISEGHACDIRLAQSCKVNDDLSFIIAEDEPRLVFVRNPELSIDIEAALLQISPSLIKNAKFKKRPIMWSATLRGVAGNPTHERPRLTGWNAHVARKHYPHSNCQVDAWNKARQFHEMRHCGTFKIGKNLQSGDR